MNKEKSYIENRFEGLYPDLERYNKEYSKLTESYNDAKIKYNKTNSVFSKKISALQAQVANLTRYLAFGRENIAGLFFSHRCAEFGVSRPVDGEVADARKAAFEKELKTK